MLDVLGTSTARKGSKLLGSRCQKLEQGLYYLPGPDGPEAVAHAHVDAFLIAFREASQAYRDALKHLVHALHLMQQVGSVVYCGRTISKDCSRIKVTQAKSTLARECTGIDLVGRTLESALTSAEVTGYRSVLGQ